MHCHWKTQIQGFSEILGYYTFSHTTIDLKVLNLLNIWMMDLTCENQDYKTDYKKAAWSKTELLKFWKTYYKWNKITGYCVGCTFIYLVLR